MVNLLNYRTNSDYDASAQIERIHTTVTIPAGSYTRPQYFYGYGPETQSGTFVDAIWKCPWDDKYYQGCSLEVYVPNSSNRGQIYAWYERYPGYLKVGVSLSTNLTPSIDPVVIPDPITIDLWIQVYKMPF